MISFSIYKYFYNNKKKWVTSISLLIIVAILLNYIGSFDFLQNGKTLTWIIHELKSYGYYYTNTHRI